ncbi:Protoheme IX farnesyltransferase, mitochondrial [Galdieria sulphuraria]|uniref:Heme O synthase n=1 Tax=Galdieria sulphuraria TaxID=130081 RepID=M2WT79_GALSU|nr:protoheme IX farnesyltransferase [Galdieria sulphuraria]EME27105.1 protoheme IX farnesyltransferase [Galdieria sulphuraria]GJD05662.1 Protoheme IX farnesyltransferase, mitochondrial [Galdieria sulphuraria]|eukprot:XP_005703625.1 protoheme IX farnesyltransferase [Galdieria sulphuraria]
MIIANRDVPNQSLFKHFGVLKEDLVSNVTMYQLSHKVLSRVHKGLAKSDKIFKNFLSLHTSREIPNSTKHSGSVPLTDNLQSKWLRGRPTTTTLTALFTWDPNVSALERHFVHSRQWNVKTFVSKPITTGLMIDSFPKKLEGTATWKDFKLLLRSYLKLSKHRLSALVVFTALVGYYMGGQVELQKLQPFNLLFLTVGTMLSAASANAWNQIKEMDKDAKMQRTKSRPLPAGLLSKRHAAIFTILTGISGVCALLFGLPDHGVAAALGGLNIILYAKVYTALKVIHPINTWIGALVGAIPPLMGWSAARQGNIGESGSLLLAAYLFLWQIPHFHSLAVMCCKDYCAGGYKMLAQLNPRANAVWSVITCLGLLCLGPLAVHLNLTSSWFGYESTALGLWMLHSCAELVKDPANPKAARPLFKVSIVYLPLLLGLMCLHRLEKLPSNIPSAIGSEERLDKTQEMSNNFKVPRRRIVYHPASYYYASFPFFPPAILPPAIVFEEDETGEGTTSIK